MNSDVLTGREREGGGRNGGRGREGRMGRMEGVSDGGKERLREE